MSRPAGGRSSRSPRAVAEVLHDLTVIDRLQSEHLALLQYLLLAEPEIVAVLRPPPRDGAVVHLRILRRQDERRHEFDQVRLRAFEPRVVQFVEVNHLCVLQLDLAVAAVPLAAELETLQYILAEREHRRVISVQVGVDVPLCGLLLLSLVFSVAHDGLMSEHRVAALDAEVVRIQRVPGASIQQPRVHRLPPDEQVVVGLHVGEATPEGGADTRLRVFLRERPELAGHEDAVTGRHRRVRLGGVDRARAGWRSPRRSTGDRCSPSAAPTGLAESLSSVGPPFSVILDVLERRAPGLHPPKVGIKRHVVLVVVDIERMRRQAPPRRRPRPPRTTPEASGGPSIDLSVDVEREAVAVEDRTERNDLARRIDDEPEIGELVPGAVVVQQRCHEQRVVLQARVRVIHRLARRPRRMPVTARVQS